MIGQYTPARCWVSVETSRAVKGGSVGQDNREYIQMAVNQLGDHTVVNSNYLFLSRKLPSFPNKSRTVRTPTKPNVSI